MTAEEFENKFYNIVLDLEQNSIKGKTINGEVLRLDELCKRYLKARAKQIKGYKKNNLLDGA